MPSSSISNATSYELWKKWKPDLTMYQVFGCQAFVHVQKKDRGQLESHTNKCIFIGFDDGYKGWKVYNPIMQRVSNSHDIIFDETMFSGTSTHPQEKITFGVLSRTLWSDQENHDIEAQDPRNHEPSTLGTIPEVDSNQSHSLNSPSILTIDTQSS